MTEETPKEAGQTTTPTADDPNPKKGWKPSTNPTVNLIIFVVAIIAIILTCLYIWNINPFTAGKRTTNNAYVNGNITIISPQVSGYVKRVVVEDFVDVDKKQPLVYIDDGTYQASLEQARAALASAQSALLMQQQKINAAKAQTVETAAQIEKAKTDLNTAKKDLARYEKLITQQAVSKLSYDQIVNQENQAKAALMQAVAADKVAQENVISAEVETSVREADIKQAEAVLAQRQIDVDHTIIHAPRKGHLSTIQVKEGQYVSPGTALMYLVPEKNWVIANFKETQVDKMSIGQAAKISVDALGGKTFTGKVSNISSATGSEYSVVPNNNATGNFIKIVQRIPVKIIFDEGQDDLDKVSPGMSVEATVELN